MTLLSIKGTIPCEVKMYVPTMKEISSSDLETIIDTTLIRSYISYNKLSILCIIFNL